MKPPNADIKYLSPASSQAPKLRASSPLNQRVTLNTLLEKSASNSSEVSSNASPNALAPITCNPFVPFSAASAY
jgi:hypothetical protein